MIKKILPLLTLLAIGMSSPKAIAQCVYFSENISDSNTQNLHSLITCCSYTATYTVVNRGSNLTCPVTVSMQLPDQITSDGSGFIYASNDGAIISNSFAVNTTPSFTITSTSSGQWKTNDTLTVTFLIKTACCMPATNSDTTTVNIDSSYCHGAAGDGLTVVAPKLSASCIYPGIHLNVTENIGSTIDFVFKIKNGGTEPINQFVNTVCPPESGLTMLGYFFSTVIDTTTDSNRNYCNYDTNYHFIHGNYSVISADTSVYDSLFRVKYFPLDSMFLHIVYKVVGCNMTSAPDTFILYCSNGSGSESCFPGVPVTTSINVIAGTPGIVISLLPPVYFDSARASYCNGDTDAVRFGFVYTNNASDFPGGARGNASADSFKIYFYSSNEMGKIDTSTLAINGYHFHWQPGFVTQVPNYNHVENPLGFTEWCINFTKWSWNCGDPLPFGSNSIAALDGMGKLDGLSNIPGQNTKDDMESPFSDKVIVN